MSKDIPISNNYISMGMDTISSLSQLQAGYSRLIRNMSLNDVGWMEKRKGYQIRSGSIPLKIKDTLYDPTQQFTEIIFDYSVSLSNVSDSPISLSTVDLSESIYVNEYNWEVIANKQLDASFYEFITRPLDTAYVSYIARSTLTEDGQDYSTILQVEGGKYMYSRAVSQAATVEYNFYEYFEGVPNGELEIVPIEMKAPEDDAIQYNLKIDSNIPTDTKDKIFDGSFSEVKVTDTVPNSWTLELPTDGGSNTDSYATYEPSTNILEIVFESSTTGFTNFLTMTQIFDGGSGGGKVIPDEVISGEDGKITIQLDVPINRDPKTFLSGLVIFGRQVSTTNFQGRVGSGVGPSATSYTISNVRGDFVVFKVMVKTLEGDYKEVLPNDIVYIPDLNEARITIDNYEIETFMFLWQEYVTPLNRIQIAGDLTNYTNGHVWGIPHANNYIQSASYGGRVNGLVNRSDVGKQELVSGLGGNLYLDTEGPNSGAFSSNPYYYFDGSQAHNIKDSSTIPSYTSESYYIPNPSIQADLIGEDSFLENFYGKRFLTSSVDIENSLGRGFIVKSNGTSVAVDGYVPIDKNLLIYNKHQKQLIIKLDSFTFERGWESEIVNPQDSFYWQHFTTRDLINIKPTGIEGFEGDVSVVSYDQTSQRLTIALPEVLDSFSLDGINSISIGCFTSDMIVKNVTMKVGDILDQKLFLLEQDNIDVISIEDYETDKSILTFNNITTKRLIPRGITLAATSKTTRLYFSSVYNLCYNDTLVIGDEDVVYKVKSIITVPSSDPGTPEYVMVDIDSEVTVTDSIISPVNIFKVGRWNPILSPEDQLNEGKFQLLDQYDYSEQQNIQMEVIKDVVLVDNYTNTTFKYDGKNIYKAGLPNWSPIYNVFNNPQATNKLFVQKIDKASITYEIRTDGKTPKITVRSKKMSLEGEVSWDSYIGRPFGFSSTKPEFTSQRPFILDSVSQRSFDEDDKPFIELIFKDLSESDLSALGVDVYGTPIFEGDGYKIVGYEETIGDAYIGVPQNYNYMARLYTTDNQGNKLISKSSGYGDYQYEQVFDGAIGIQLKVPDNLIQEQNNGNWEIELLRTQSEAPDVYYFITSRKINPGDPDRIMIYDALDDGALLEGDLDSLAGFVGQGDTLATTISGPAKALYTTTADNRYIQANIQSEELIDLVFITQLEDRSFVSAEDDEAGKTAWHSRVENSELKIEGQSYLKDGILTDVKYQIVPEMASVIYSELLPGADVPFTKDARNVNCVYIEDDYVYALAGESTEVNDLITLLYDNPKAVTFHSPLSARSSGLGFIDYNPSLHDMQGTHTDFEVVVVNYEDVDYHAIKIPRPGTTLESDFFGNLQLTSPMFVTVHTLFEDTDNNEEIYTIRIPTYPARLDFGINGSSAYAGQYYDPKSAKYRTSLGNYVGSEFTDIQEYVYHTQEVLDRLGRINSPYPVFPLYTERSATDKFYIGFRPKTDDITGLSVRWKNGVQCIVQYQGLILDHATLSEPYAFYKKVYPSRVILSAPNYPEIFSNPFIENTTDLSVAIGSSSAIDVNSDDGQEITGLASFLSESLFNASNLDSIILIFKTNSVYALDISGQAKRVDKLETAGVGCNIPNSIQSTSHGIMFANENGIYLITRQLTLVYLGKPLEGIWRQEVDFSKRNEIVSFNNTKDRHLYISAPTKDGGRYVFVYSYSLEGIRQEPIQRGWTVYTEIDSSTWTKTNTQFYNGSFNGLVMEDRSSGDVRDFRDNEDGITSVIEYAPTSFGDNATRAQLNKVISHIEYITDVTGCIVGVATDTSTDFKRSGTINLKDNGQRLRSVYVVPVDHKALLFQVRWEHSTKDETLKLTGIDYRASLADSELFEEADD